MSQKEAPIIPDPDKIVEFLQKPANGEGDMAFALPPSNSPFPVAPEFENFKKPPVVVEPEEDGSTEMVATIPDKAPLYPYISWAEGKGQNPNFTSYPQEEKESRLSRLAERADIFVGRLLSKRHPQTLRGYSNGD